MSSKVKIAGCGLLVILFEAAGVRSFLYPDYVQAMLYTGAGIMLGSSLMRRKI